jgi:hypothetical protein
MAARKFTASKLPLAFRGKGGASSTYLTLLGLQRSRLTLTEGLKRFGGDKKGIGCAVFQLSPDRSMKPQSDVWLIASFAQLFASAPAGAEGFKRVNTGLKSPFS